MVPTWDLVLLIFFGVSLIYGFLMGREKIILTLLGAYVGLVIANQWATSAFGLITNQSSTILNDKFVSGNVSIFTVKVALFVVTILVIAFRGGLLGHAFMGGRGIVSLFVQTGYSFLSAALIAASILEFLPLDVKSRIVEGSLIAGPLVSAYAWWLVLPVIMMAMTGFLSRED
ncbi:hypothetical protein KKE14_00235 [Patescibacteria group bacterium]|nr:hypothetical protein [Patescibacteria group bacterium]